MPNKEEFFVDSKAVLARHLDICLEGMSEDNVMIVKKLIDKKEAVKRVEQYLAGDFLKDKRLSKRVIKGVIAKNDVAKIEGVYFNVLGYLYHASKVEFGYSYRYNGSPISISPHVYNCDMDINAFFLPYDIDYHLDLSNKRMDIFEYGTVSDDDIVSELEPGFKIRTVGNIEHDYAKNKASDLFLKRFKEKLKDEKQKELGVSKPIFHINLADFSISCTKMDFMLPFYLFHYDTGKEIVTIAVNAYTGKISEPLLGNPVASVKYALEDGLAYPSFSVAICIIASFISLFLGGVIYALKHALDVAKYNGKTKKLPYSDQQLLI